MRTWIAAAGVAILTFVGCAPAASPQAGTTVYEELLSLVPDTPENRSLVQINDIALARQLFGVPEPRMSGGGEDQERYVLSLITLPDLRLLEAPWISAMGINQEAVQKPPVEVVRERRKYLAFDARHVDQTLLLPREPKQLEVLRGRFDPDDTRRAVEGCAECPQPELVNYLGLTYYRWGNDFSTSAQLQNSPPAFDRYGRGGRIAVQDQYVFRTVYTEGIESLIAAQRGAMPSLAAREELRLLARGMTDLGAYTMFLTDQTPGPDLSAPLERGGGPIMRPSGEGHMEGMRTAMARAPLLRPYHAIAMGAGKDAEGLYLAVALVHEDEQAATENVALLRRRVEETESVFLKVPWGEIFRSVEVRWEGRLALAKLRGERATRLPPEALLDGEVLFTHE